MRFWNAVGYLDPRQAAPVAQACESAGFHGVVIPDHSHYPRQLSTPYPYTPDGSPPFPAGTPWPDPWVVAATVMAVTTTLRCATAVYVAPARPLHVVAHQVGTAAYLSDGRVVLGVGVGWMREDYDVHGVAFEGRGRRLDEMIDALRALWEPGWVSFAGDHFTVPEMLLSPDPPGPVPIWAGGESEPALRRAARRCDGWILAGPMGVDDVRDRVQDMHGRLRAEGRDPEAFTILAMAPDAWDVDFHRSLEALGVHDVVAVPWRAFDSALEDKRDDIDRFVREVMSRVPGTARPSR